jgi:TatD DNase family protein
MSPEPHRGKVCHSGYIEYIANKVAELHKTSIQDVAQITTRNTSLLFDIH